LLLSIFLHFFLNFLHLQIRHRSFQRGDRSWLVIDRLLRAGIILFEPELRTSYRNLLSSQSRSAQLLHCLIRLLIARVLGEREALRSAIGLLRV
ncbi:hypothetical protein PFISCL1PPCAC_21262, partial [Pristionchus fissidentatus]